MKRFNLYVVVFGDDPEDSTQTPITPSTTEPTTTSTTKAPTTTSTTKAPTTTSTQPTTTTQAPMDAPPYYGMSKRTFDQYGNVFIDPGSRPYLATDNDPSIPCYQNAFQSRCNSSSEVQRRIACVNFINGSDSQLVWWQEIQRSAIFAPSDYIYWRSNSRFRCPLFGLVNFYISETSKNSNKIIDFSRGELLKNFDLFSTINVCYKTPEANFNHAPDVLFTLINCLTLYGDGLASI